MLFSEFSLLPHIQTALKKQGYSEATPIQERAIPHILAGRDVLGAAQTGTGKTAAFAIPTLQLLYQEEQLSNVTHSIRSLILTPIRELAIQIEENIRNYGNGMGLRHAVIFGGVSQVAQVQKLKK